MAAPGPERASRHLEARSCETRQAKPQHIAMLLQHVVTTERRCFNAYLPEHQRPRGKTPNATSLWYARYLRRILTLRRFCRTSPSKLSAMPLGIICLPTGTPPACSSFWWISPSFCLSS